MEQLADNLDLIKKAQDGDHEALEKAITQNQLLIYSLLKRYHYAKEDQEDLLQVANIGLIKAIQNFDFSYDVSFSTYAVPLILGEIKRYFREKQAVHVSRSTKELYQAIVKAQEELEKNFLRNVTLSDISEYLNVSIEDIVFAYESQYKPCSLDSTLSDEEDITLIDTIKDRTSDFTDNLEIKMAIEKLEPKERLFIELRFYQGLKQSEIAERLFVSQVQVSRIEKKIIDKLREILI